MSNSTNLSTTNVSTVDGVEVHTDHWINGRWVASADRFANHSPIDGSHLADVAAGGSGEVDAARVFLIHADSQPPGAARVKLELSLK